MIPWFPIMANMHNLQTIETPKMLKSSLGLELNFLLMQECKKTSTSHLTSSITFFNIFSLSFLLFIIHAYPTRQTLVKV